MTITSISANELKTKGVAAIEAALASQPEATVSVRGKERFVVMELSHYHYLRECELEEDPFPFRAASPPAEGTFDQAAFGIDKPVLPYHPGVHHRG